MTPRHRILLVEDEPALRLVARAALEKVGGFEVHGCASGAEALCAISDFRPDLLILDVMMPQMDGPTTLRAIREGQYSDAPAIFLTAKVQSREIDALLKLGAVGVLKKPFDPMQLSNDVNALWKRDAAGSST